MGKNFKKLSLGFAVSAASLAMIKSKKIRKFLALNENFQSAENILQTILAKFVKGGVNV